MNFSLAFVMRFVATVEQTENGRFRQTSLCMPKCITVEERFFTSLCIALKLKAGKSVLDNLVHFFFGIYRSAIRTGSFSTLFHMPALFTFFAHKTRALSALNRIVHHE
jgi:hypothetical protein